MIFENILALIYIAFMYLLVFLAVPAFVVYPLVKGKSFGFRIFSYLVSSHFYILNVVYLLGYANIFYFWTVLPFILIPVIYRIYCYRKYIKLFISEIQEVNLGNYSLRLLARRSFSRIKEKFIKQYGFLWKKNLFEIIIFIVLIVAIISFYGYYKFHYVSYGVADEEVHLYWVQSLMGGTMFVSGMYPFGIHSVMAVLATLTGLNSTIVVHMFSIILLVLTVSTLFIFLRKFFRFRMGILFSIFFWLLSGFGGIYVYFRFQYTLPMEYGLFAVFASVFFMICYIETGDRITVWLFSFAVSYTFSSHFYLTGLTAILCISMGITYIWPLLKNKIIHILIAMAIIGIIFSMLPFAAGYVIGYKFEQSIDWALSVMEKDDTPDESDEPEEVILNPKDPQQLYQGVYKGMSELAELNKNELHLLFVLEGVLLVMGLIGLLFSRNKYPYSFFLGSGIAWAALVFLSVASSFGISEFVEAKRVLEWIFIFNTILFAAALESIYRIAGWAVKREDFGNVLMIYIAGSLFYLDVSNGYFKTERPCAMNQTEQVATLCRDLYTNYEKNTWTIVSPVNERSMVINSGYHYEWLDLLEELNDWDENQEIYIPTKYVFFAIEKYRVTYGVVDILDKKSLENRVKVNIEDAAEELDYSISVSERSGIYQDDREIVMSKAYYWAQEYSKNYPHEMLVYYEDDEVIIYCLKQDVYSLNNLSDEYGFN